VPDNTALTFFSSLCSLFIQIAGCLKIKAFIPSGIFFLLVFFLTLVIFSPA